MKTPSAEVTPKDVVRYARKHMQKVSEEDAAKWLEKYASLISRQLRCVVEDALDDILSDITLREYPDPTFNAMFQRVDDAIWTAAEEYATAHGKVTSGSAFSVEGMDRLVSRFVKANRNRRSARAAFQYEFSFAHSVSPGKDTPLVSYSVMVVLKNSSVTASVKGPVRGSSQKDGTSSGKIGRKTSSGITIH